MEFKFNSFEDARQFMDDISSIFEEYGEISLSEIKKLYNKKNENIEQLQIYPNDGTLIWDSSFVMECVEPRDYFIVIIPEWASIVVTDTEDNEKEIIKSENSVLNRYYDLSNESDVLEKNTMSYILKEADKIVNGKRLDEYGTPEDNFKLIGSLWSNYLGVDISSFDVSMLMILLKVARIRTGKMKEDSFIDIAGYSACGAEIALKKED